MKEIYFQFIWSSYYIDSSNYQNPVKFSYENSLLRGSAMASRSDIFYYRIFNYYSDNGFILEDKSHYTGFFMSKHEFDSIQDPDTELIWKMYLTVDKFHTKIERAYVKVQKIAADIGGIVKFFSMLLALISNHYNRFKFYDYLIRFFMKEGEKTNIIMKNSFSNKANISSFFNKGIQKNIYEKDGRKTHHFLMLPQI